MDDIFYRRQDAASSGLVGSERRDHRVSGEEKTKAIFRRQTVIYGKKDRERERGKDTEEESERGGPG